ncbi:MAG: flagellar filament capping protein FliD [Acidobacteria bacterium]|nr:flagellar filament capping protein FliD [Acidobacteriota bacterium]
MALGSITFGQGLVSGLNFRQMADAIIQAQRVPIDTLETRVDRFESIKKRFSELSTKLGTFNTALEALRTEKVGGKTVSLPEDAPLSASATHEADLGTYEISVTALAQAHRVRSDGFADRDDPLLTAGTISIQSGDNDVITIDVSAANGNNSLQAVAESINAADAGVSASIINDGTRDILVVRASETGTDNALTISDTTNLNLDAGGNVLQVAQNAALTVDGVAISSQDNIIGNAISGVTLTLTGETTAPVQLTVSEDVESTKQAIRDFVTAYNEVNDFIYKQFTNSADAPSTDLATNSALRSVQRQLQDTLTKEVNVPEGNLDSLAVLGIGIADQTGRVEFDEARFDDLVEDGRFSEIRPVLFSEGDTTDPMVLLVGQTAATEPGRYAVHITQAAEEAVVRGSAAVRPTGITHNETLTITFNGEITTANVSVGDDIDDIVTKINAALLAAGFDATASSDAGVLVISSDKYGSDQSLTVVSSRNDPGNGTTTGIGQTPRSDTGVDVAGTIGGYAAVGKAQELTGAEGTPVEGLHLKITATLAQVVAKGGDFGYVGVSEGVIEAFEAMVDYANDPYDGVIQSIQENYDKSIQTLQDRIEAMEERLTQREELLIRQFSAAEAAIAQLQGMMSAIGAQTS